MEDTFYVPAPLMYILCTFYVSAQLLVNRVLFYIFIRCEAGFNRLCNRVLSFGHDRYKTGLESGTCVTGFLVQAVRNRSLSRENTKTILHY